MNSINQIHVNCLLLFFITGCAFTKRPTPLAEGAKEIKIVRDVSPECLPIKKIDFRTSSIDSFADARNIARNMAVEESGNLVRIDDLKSRGQGMYVEFKGEILKCPQSGER